MTFGSLEVVFFTLAFVVPGFILDSMVSALLPRRVEDAKLFLLRFLTFSCVNYALWSWLIYLLFQSEFFAAHSWAAATAWFLIVFLSPVLLGLGLAKLNQRGVVRAMLQRLGFNPVHIIPTAWDWKFSATQEPVWVMVTLKNGDAVCGLFGSSSFASSVPEERDLFLQEVYRVGEGLHWEPVVNSDGILFRAGEIKHIEFWRDAESESHAKPK